MKKNTVALSLTIVALMAMPVMAQANESTLLDNGFQIRANSTEDTAIESTAGLITSPETADPGETIPEDPTDPGETDPEPTETETPTEPEVPAGRIGSFTIMCDEDTVVSAPIVSTSLATVTWDDGTTEAEERKSSDKFEAKAEVEYTVTTEGVASALATSSNDCLRSVNEWPEGLNTLREAFYEQNNLTSVPSYLPSEVTSMRSAFYGAEKFNDDALSSWDVSNVRDMMSAFRESHFNQDISDWNVSNVTNMSRMFQDNDSFNKPLNNWGAKVGKVTTMYYMFSDSVFNQDISDWDVSRVSNMRQMFQDNSAFNQPLAQWGDKLGRVSTMAYMFYGTVFDQDISVWDTSNVGDMRYMFASSQFDHPIGDWNISKVADLSFMFFNSPFNQDISRWDVSNVTDMRNLFGLNVEFNQPLSAWGDKLGKVTDMSGMFAGTVFNHSISNWDVSNVTTMGGMFGGSEFNQPLNAWGSKLGNVTDMSTMFAASKFNQPLTDWNVSGVENMSRMFFHNYVFNQPLSSWNDKVSNVTTMESMFNDASLFNQNLSGWNVSNVTDYENFNQGSRLTSANLPKFES